MFNDASLNENEILNLGLAYPMEFGKNWLQPIQEKLAKRYPALTEQELNKYDSICRKAMDVGVKFIYDELELLIAQQQIISQQQLKELFSGYMSENYRWVNQKNLAVLFSQGCYYAYKDGLDAALK